MRKIVLFFALIGAITIGNVNAQTIVGSGSCGDNLTWVLDSDSVLTISGTGNMANYGENYFYTQAPWYSYYRNHITKVIVESGITSIGSYAFDGCSNAHLFNISSDLNSIGSGAFRDCLSLTSINIPEGVTSIGGYTFSGCTNLTSIDIPDGVTRIEERTFFNCSNLTSIDLSNITYIGSVAFGNSGLTSVTIPENVTSIGDGAFGNCNNLQTINYNAINCPRSGFSSIFSSTSLATVNIGQRVKNIPNGFVRDCSGLTTVNMNDSVTDIRQSAFWNCSSLTSINLPQSLINIESSAFSGCGFTSITIPENVTVLGLGAFSGCHNLETVNYNVINLTSMGGTSSSPFGNGENFKTVNIGNNVKSLYSYLFAYCPTLETVNFNSADSLTGIGIRTFIGCTNLTSITIPQGIEYISTEAFMNCTNLETVNYIAKNCTTFANSAFKGCTSFTTVNIGDNVTYIPNSAFSYATLTTVNMGENVKQIGTNAFYGTAITSITIPENIFWVGTDAFKNCTNLETVNYNAINCEIMNQGFLGCTNFTTLNIGNRVKSIPDNAFRNGNAYSTLAHINFSDSLITIGSSAFRGCVIDGTLTIPNSVLKIKDHAFYAGGFSSVIIPENTTSIEWNAFAQCPNLETIYFNAIDCETNNAFSGNALFSNLNIGNRVKRISEQAFYNCTALTSVSMGDSIETIESGAFKSCGMASISIPESVTRIKQSAFDDCLAMETVNFNAINSTTDNQALFMNNPLFTTLNIGNRVKTIPNSAFWGCDALTNVTFGDSITTIGHDAFRGCGNIETLELPAMLTQIAYQAFYGCTNIYEVTTHAVTPPTLEGNSFPILPNASVYIPCLTYSDYSNDFYWGNYFKNFIVNGPKSDTTYYNRKKCYGAVYSDSNFSDIYSIGNYYITLENQSNCDSVVCLILSEYDYIQPFTYQASICQGGSYSDANFTDLTTAGYHSITLQNINGCDSIVRVNLSIIPAPVHNYSATICNGSSYSDDNFTDLTIANNYSVTLQTSAGCDSIVNLQLSLINSPEQELCMISVDMEYHNQIIWKRQEEITAYNIYREGNIVGQYELAATIPYEDINSWIDMESNAKVRSHSYKISAIDTCGNESELSSPHKTMHLTINQGVGSSWNLIWTPYEGTGYSTYNIYRAVGKTFGELELISTIPSSLSSFTDFISTGDAYVYYMVEIVLNETCEVDMPISAKSVESSLKNTETAFATIRSNVATNNPDDILIGVENEIAENSIQIYPNPVKDNLTIDYGGLIINNVKIMDLSGKIISQFNYPINKINVSPLSQGTYFVKIESDKGFLTKLFIKK